MTDRCPSRRRARRTGAALALLLTAVATAGVQLVDSNGTPYAWDLDTPQPNVVAGKVTYFVDPAGTSDVITGPLADVSAVRTGVREWEIGSSRIRFEEDPTRRANGRNANDRVNYIGWVGSGLGRLTLAVTFPTRSGSDILDMDILFNDRDYEWDTRSPGISGVADIQSILTHEWGHALGADHVPLRESSMYFSSTSGRTAYRSLSADDVALVGSIYPNDTFRQTTGSLRGTVTRFGASEHRAIHVVAISLVTNLPAASTLTAPDGRYVIQGLPRGAYRLIAAPTIPLDGAMNSFWTDGSTEFLPSVLRTEDANPAPSVSILVQPDAVTDVPAFEVRDEAAPFEPNASRGQAQLVDLGDALVARFENNGDEDWFAFDAIAGQRITISVVAWQIGSDVDPAIVLTSANGVPIASQDDVRDGRIFGRREEGPDLDARLIGVEIPSTGRYFVQVRSEGAADRDDNFYVLFVTPASDAPSAALSTVTAAPARLDADGTSTTVLTVTPRRETGDDVGPGATVTLAHDGAGTAPFAATDEGDGRYTATVTAPTTPGRDRFTVTVSTPDGVAVMSDAAVLVYLGPANAGTTSIDVRPRRIAADGVSTSTVHLLPRDADGESLGAGRSVVLSAAGVTPAAASDVGDGAYDVLVTAGDAAGTVDLRALVDGIDLGAVAVLHLGFDLREVIEQATADSEAFLANDGLSKKAASALRSVVKKAGGVLGALDAGSTKKALARTRGVLAKFLRAEKKAKGALPSLGTSQELALAIREAAQAAIARAVVETGKDQKALDRARDDVLEGDAFLDFDSPKKAAARYQKAFRRVLGLQP